MFSRLLIATLNQPVKQQGHIFLFLFALRPVMVILAASMLRSCSLSLKLGHPIVHGAEGDFSQAYRS